VVLLITAAAARDFLSGTWTLNVAKSNYATGTPPKSQVTVLEERDGGLHEQVTRVNADGTTTRWELFAKYDNKDTWVTGDPSRDAVAVKRIDDRTVEVTNKKNDVVTTRMKIVVSADGKTRTNTVTGTDANGKPVTSVMLFDRK
jgi:hypothetical protein